MKHGYNRTDKDISYYSQCSLDELSSTFADEDNAATTASRAYITRKEFRTCWSAVCLATFDSRDKICLARDGCSENVSEFFISSSGFTSLIPEIPKIKMNLNREEDGRQIEVRVLKTFEPRGSCTELKETGSMLVQTGGSYACQAIECDDPHATLFTLTLPKSSTGVGF